MSYQWRDMGHITAADAEAEPAHKRLFAGPRAGYIYLMRVNHADDDGYYPCKIGKSKDVPTRQRQIGLVMPYEVELVHFVAVNDMVRAETFLHEVYEPYRMRGEWFRFPQEGVDQFCQMHRHGVYDINTAL